MSIATRADSWSGVWGQYPIPERFAPLVNGSPAVNNRRDALKLTGEFYSWLYAQECRGAAAAMGRINRHAKRATRQEATA